MHSSSCLSPSWSIFQKQKDTQRGDHLTACWVRWKDLEMDSEGYPHNLELSVCLRETEHKRQEGSGCLVKMKAIALGLHGTHCSSLRCIEWQPSNFGADMNCIQTLWVLSVEAGLCTNCTKNRFWVSKPTYRHFPPNRDKFAFLLLKKKKKKTFQAKCFWAT